VYRHIPLRGEVGSEESSRRVGRTKALSYSESVDQGGKTGARKSEPATKAGPLPLGLLRSLLEGLGCRFGLGFCLGLRLLLGSELLLDLEGDGVGVLFVRSGSVAEDLNAAAARGGQHDGQLNQHAAQRSFLGAAQVGGKQLLLGCRVRFLIASQQFAAQSVGFDATHPLMSSITTTVDPTHRGQITGMTTFANFLGMDMGALCFHHLIRFGFGTPLAVFASAQTLSGVAALYAFRRERPQMNPIRKACQEQANLISG
jgi:hypothetical protein